MSLSTDDMRKGDPRKPRELSGLVWGIFRALNFFFLQKCDRQYSFSILCDSPIRPSNGGV